MNAKPVVVSLAWGDKYLPLADRLEKDAKAAGLVSMITRKPGAPAARGVDAWSKKPSLLTLAQELTNQPVLWVDIDFEIAWKPSLFDVVTEDVAAYTNGFKRGVYEDGVVWFNTTAKGRETLAEWMRRCELPGLEWSHHALSAAMLTTECSVRDLPPEYHWVPRWKMPEQYGPRTPIIRENPLKQEAACVP